MWFARVLVVPGSFFKKSNKGTQIHPPFFYFCLQRQYTNKIHMNAQAELLKSKGAKHSR